MSASADHFILVLKRDCPTCVLIEPVVAELEAAGIDLEVWSQDDPDFPQSATQRYDDSSLETSYRLGIEITPTVIRQSHGQEIDRTMGWDRSEWLRIFELANLGADLPGFRPGCGSMSTGPGMAEVLALRFGDSHLDARRIEISEIEDEIEACFDRGWSDGLPLVPPTELRVLRMLAGTDRAGSEQLGLVPPDLQPCTVEKAAINAVMAGCKPEYFPVVIAAIEAALEDEFCMHGLLATTWFSGPMIVVNGPITTAIGMNSGGNALGQGNRANATIGRALQLVIRNVGGGRPGGVDQSTFGHPGKYTFCFAENEADSCWESLAVERGFDALASTVTLFASDGVQGIIDQQSREPESLCNSFAQSLLAVGHPKFAMGSDATLVISPEHQRIFAEAGWSKTQFKQRIDELTVRPGADLVRGAGNIAEGLPDTMRDQNLPKFRPGGFNVIHAGGAAGMFSAIIGGWVASGGIGSTPVTREIDR